jgi:transcriptional regulator with XRE-family HTH domain
LKFVAFIEEFTVRRLAKRTGVGVRSVYRWKNGEAVPAVENIVLISKLSKGRVTYGDIIHHYLDNRA